MQPLEPWRTLLAKRAIAWVACLIGFWAHGQAPTTGPLIPVAALQADLDHLERRVLHRHPAPFMYGSREQWAHCFDSLRATITAPMSAVRFLAHISSVYPLLGDGHTLFLPDDADAPRGLLPLDVACIGQRLYIRGNGATDPRLAPGTEILAINGTGASKLLDTLLARQVRDGCNTTYPQWIIDHWFRSYYRFSYGEPERFDLLLRRPEGDVRVLVDALPPDSIAAHIARNGSLRPPGPVFGVHLPDGDSIAVLTIPSFETGALTAAMIDGAFHELRERGAQRLILDLRGNQGGEPKYAKQLLAHLLGERFELVHRGPASGPTRPERDAFCGALVVLMDGGSFSATGMVLACLQRHHRATFVGEEAGGNRTVLAGSPKHFTLPHTRLNGYLSTRLWQLADQANDGHGVLPDLPVAPTIDDLLNGRDAMMEAGRRALR